jgi:phosphatidylglycerol lysyltransferase
MSQTLTQADRVKRSIIVSTIAYAVMLSALLLIASTLPDQHIFRYQLHINLSIVKPGITLFIGLSLLYLSFRLRRRKHTAWLASSVVYAIILLASIGRISTMMSGLHHIHQTFVVHLIADIVLPVVILAGLFIYHDYYTVKSDIRSFGLSLRFVVLVLAVALIYGVTGFLLMDNRDFHQEIGVGDAIHHTIDQFGLTTSSNLVPYTRRAQAFLDSLSIISIGAVGYAIVSLFQPIRVRFTEQAASREKARELVERYPASSEDFFKLWPHDKLYFFNESQTAGLAYSAHRGIALVVGDPFGDKAAHDELLNRFDELCFTNDWSPAFIHTEPQYNELYKEHEFALQKIGEEAILDLEDFKKNTEHGKYFRQIRNKFNKQQYTTEVLMPPHNEATMKRLREISQDWLGQPGREERGFMMGYFSTKYMQACPVMVLRDGAGTIQGFINQILSFDETEANFDLLRHTKDSLGNSNDFLMTQFISYIHEQGFKRLNLGLCPLAGLAAHDEERSVVDNALRFVYANGDRFYSFSGLHRFKAKYEPSWHGRYIAYRGGIGNFTRVLNALNRAMRV